MRLDLTGIVGAFALMWIVSLGCGLAVERLLRLRLANALLLPLGLCVSIVLIFPGYVLGVADPLAIALLAAVSIAGLVIAREGLPRRLNPGWPGLAGLGAYLLFMLPVLAHGGWTWSGYDFVNDSAFEMLLADHIRGFGTTLGHLPESSERQFLVSYLHNGYPLGAQALLGTDAAILDVSSAVIYQAFISGLAAITAIAMALIVSRVLRPARAALVALVAAAANLTYQYALQGSIKEIGLVAGLACTVALIDAALSTERPYAGAALVAIGAAASLTLYSAVALPFLGGIALFAAGAFLFVRRVSPSRVRPSRAWLAPVAAGCVLLFVLALPSLTSFTTFFNVARTGQGASGAGAIQFGQLLRSLPVSQISGVWLAGEYRTPVVPEPAALLTVIATVVVLVLCIPGAVWALRRGAAGPLLLLGSVGLVLLIVFPRVSPYAQGKLLAIGGPAVLLAALLIPAGASGRLRVPGTVLMALIGVAVLASDVLAYGRARVAPSPRMEAIAQVGHHFRGEGLVLFNEFEEYAKYFGREAHISDPFEALTPQQVLLRVPRPFYGDYFDLDEEQLGFVEGYPIIVYRRSPAASRPPANYRLAYANRYYLAWRRTSGPRVLSHLPLQQLYAPSGIVPCRTLARMVAGAPAKSTLVAPATPELKWFEPLYSKDRSIAWGLIPTQHGAVATNGPGHASGTLHIRGGAPYAVWVQGDFPAPIKVYLDGRLIGTASGSNTPLQWERIATRTLPPGAHTLEVVREAGHRHFGPGEWQSGVIGAVALQRQEAERTQTLPLSRWRSLCGSERDWVEVVTP